MKLLAFLLLSTLASASEARLFMWQESRDEKGERQYSFYIGSPSAEKAMLTEEEPADGSEPWAYGILLRGRASQYPTQKIVMFRLEGHELVEVGSGTVDVDWKKREIVVALEIVSQGRMEKFRGNGRFPLKSRSLSVLIRRSANRDAG